MQTLYKQVYQPLVDAVPFLNKDMIVNAKGDLKASIQSGKVIFYRGQFKGNFNSRTSRDLVALGAKWNRSTQTWDILQSQLPADIVSMIRSSDMAFDATLLAVETTLGNILPDSFVVKSVAEDFFNTEIFKLDRDLTKEIKKITVPAQLTTQERLNIASEYAENFDRYIKNFTEGQITKLREMIQINKYSGNRYENLIKTIEDNFEVTKNKAKFLARQETNLLTAQYKEERAVSSGSVGYIWKTIGGTAAHPVRADHKRLEGKFFPWGDPPVTNLKTGAKNNPGQDYNCRCRAAIVFKIPDDAE